MACRTATRGRVVFHAPHAHEPARSRRRARRPGRRPASLGRWLARSLGLSLRPGRRPMGLHQRPPHGRHRLRAGAGAGPVPGAGLRPRTHGAGGTAGRCALAALSAALLACVVAGSAGRVELAWPAAGGLAAALLAGSTASARSRRRAARRRIVLAVVPYHISCGLGMPITGTGRHAGTTATSGATRRPLAWTAAAGVPLRRALTVSASAAAGVTVVGSLVSAAAAAPYLVRPGDTLSAIARRFHTTVPALAALNHLPNPNLIYAGSTLQTATPRPAPAPAPGPAPAPAPPAAQPASSTYLVRPGDTLTIIARRFHTTVAVLAALNHISDPNLIYAGQTLQVGGATPAPSQPAPGTAAAQAAATAVRVAEAQVGKPYVYGGGGPDSFDCSGLVMYAWGAAGVRLGHNSALQYNETTRITAAQLRPGDLVFYDVPGYPASDEPEHVAMYIGDVNGTPYAVAADDTSYPIHEVPLSWEGTPMGYGRA